MSESEHRVVFDNLGAYALGALPDREREVVAAHLDTCPVCAEDAAALERAATRLIDVVPLLAPPPELRDRIMAVVEPEAALLRAATAPAAEVRIARPRRRPAWLEAVSLRWVATGAALLVIGGAVGATVLGSGSSGDGTRTLSAQVGSGAGDSAALEVKAGRADLVVRGLAAPEKQRVYQVWVQHGKQAPRSAGALFVVRSGRIDIPARVGPGDRVMVTEEPVGGSASPTSAPVVVTGYA